MTRIEKHVKMTHIPRAKKAYSTTTPLIEPHVANVNPSRPNDNLEGEAKGPGLSFLGLLIHTGYEISTERRDWDNGRVPDLSNPRRCAWVSGRIWRGYLGFRPDLAKSFGFPAGAETHARYLSLAAYRERSGWNTTYSGRFSLPLSFSVTGRCAWVTDLSSSLSFSVAVRISLPLSFSVAGRHMNRSNIKKLIQNFRSY